MRRRFAILSFAALALVVAAALPLLVAAKEKDSGTGELVQNVQVLPKTMRVADARRLMLTLNEALGVQCRDCHDLRDFASDAKEMKLEARRMMLMQKSINEKWFAGKETVTCFTCHNGATVPLKAPAKGSALADSAAAADSASALGD